MACLSPDWRQAIIWTNAEISIGPLGTNISEILIEIQTFSFTMMHLKLSSAKWRPFCPGGDEINKSSVRWQGSTYPIAQWPGASGFEESFLYIPGKQIEQMCNSRSWASIKFCICQSLDSNIRLSATSENNKSLWGHLIDCVFPKHPQISQYTLCPKMKWFLTVFL